MVGVYVITNEKTGEQYVGASYDVSLRFRQHQHELRKGRHYNKRLQAAWNRDGEAAFSFEGLEKKPENETDMQWLDRAEERWQRKLKPAYNIALRHGYDDDNIPMRAVS